MVRAVAIVQCARINEPHGILLCTKHSHKYNCGKEWNGWVIFFVDQNIGSMITNHSSKQTHQIHLTFCSIFFSTLNVDFDSFVSHWTIISAESLINHISASLIFRVQFNGVYIKRGHLQLLKIRIKSLVVSETRLKIVDWF